MSRWTPLTLPLPTAPEGPLRVGDFVVLAAQQDSPPDGSWCLQSSQSHGRLGVIVVDDGSSVPFEVKLVVGPPESLGKKNWYMAKRLRRYTGPQPPEGLQSLLEPLPGSPSRGAAAPGPRPSDNIISASRPTGSSSGSFPLSLPLPAEVPGSRRLQEGDFVVLAQTLRPVPDSEWCLGGSQAEGRLAVVERDDGSAVPFMVKLVVGPPDKIGATNWYTESQLLRYAGPAPLPGMRTLLELPPGTAAAAAAVSGAAAVGGAGAAPIRPASSAGGGSSSAAFSMGDTVTLAAGLDDSALNRVLGRVPDASRVGTIVALEPEGGSGSGSSGSGSSVGGGGAVTVQLTAGDTNRIGKRSVYARAELRLLPETGAGGAGGAGGGVAPAAASGGWTPLSLPLPTAPSSRRPAVGDLVVLGPGVSATARLVLGESQADGRLGELVEDARDHQPFKVKLVAGPEALRDAEQMHWYYEREIAVYTGPRPPPGLTRLT